MGDRTGRGHKMYVSAEAAIDGGSLAYGDSGLYE